MPSPHPHIWTKEHVPSMITLWSNKKTTKNPKTTIRKILLFSKLIMTMDAHKWIQHKSASLYTARHVFVASVNICGNTTWNSREADLIHYESEWNDATNLTCGNGLNITLIVELLLITWLLSASLSSLSISSIHKKGHYPVLCAMHFKQYMTSVHHLPIGLLERGAVFMKVLLVSF